MKRTRASVCANKARFASQADAMAVARTAAVVLRPYRCDRCRRFHLTSRTKGGCFRRRDAAGN
ncbi:MAG: hypothetical protein C0500_07060 [Sphingobium sp.]|nr:hypothetical protein [Sphingobium sp.]